MADTAKTVYFIHPRKEWRDIVADALYSEKGYKVKTFASVDQALSYMGWSERSPHLTRRLPDAIVTQDDTGSNHSGLDLLAAASQVTEKRIACVLLDPSRDTTKAKIFSKAGSNVTVVRGRAPFPAFIAEALENAFAKGPRR